MLEITRLPPERWKEARDLRLTALKTEPTAFGSSYEEEVNFSEAEWRRRTANALFAMLDNRPVGTITYLINERAKTKHIAQIFGVYVDPKFRGRGLGRKMLEKAIDLIVENKDIVKVRLTVNAKRSAAITLYKSLGFVIIGELKKELRVAGEFYDEVIMEKML
ncbi:MAG TPA: GNAT family N-acetyltransferase [Nitrososphaerales archaeon]|nr:GNAT family N-acetyltransferase [Nitrososphaerales archaeon]